MTGDCLDALVAAPVSGGSIFLGKALANSVLLLVLECISLPIFVIFYNVNWPSALGQLLLVFVLGTWGLTVVGTTFSALTANNRLRELMLPLLVFPDHAAGADGLRGADFTDFRRAAPRGVHHLAEASLRLRRDFLAPRRGLIGCCPSRLSAVNGKAAIPFRLGRIGCDGLPRRDKSGSPRRNAKTRASGLALFLTT